MKKGIKFLSAIFAFALILVLIACGGGNGDETPTPTQADDPVPQDPVVTPSPTGLPDGIYIGADGNYRFENTRTISAVTWCRGGDRLPDFADSYWAQWVSEEMLRVHNVNVEWVSISRWGPEYDILSTFMGANDAPDVSMTFSGSLVQSFQDMGAMIDIMPYLQAYGSMLPNLYGHLTEDVVYWNLNPETNELFSLMGREAIHGRVVTFVREDWLAALDLDIPTSHQEFEDMLFAFQENADILPGDVNAQNIIPFGASNDVTWDIQNLIESFIPTNISEREWYIFGADDRRFHHRDATYQALEIVNNWFYNGLMWGDLGVGETEALQDEIRLGRVGSFQANWDLPFRGGDRFITDMRENVNEDANFIAIQPFPADNGQPQIFLADDAMRNIFFPHTNNEVVASLLFLDFMSRSETLLYLQLGQEGVHWVMEDGVVVSLDEDEDNPWDDRILMPSARNFDITTTANGIFDIDTVIQLYPGIDPEQVRDAIMLSYRYGRRFAPVFTPAIVSQGELSGLNAVRNDTVIQLVRGTTPANFSSEFDRLYAEYMGMGGQAIIDERTQVWSDLYGATENR